MAEQYGIVGDDYGTSLPEVQLDTDQLIEEKKAAKYSQSAEFKKLRAHFEERINFYQNFLPDGRLVSTVSPKELAETWAIANAIITELKAVIGYYDRANEAVKETQ